jgi:hypothetical protein
MVGEKVPPGREMQARDSTAGCRSAGLRERTEVAGADARAEPLEAQDVISLGLEVGRLNRSAEYSELAVDRKGERDYFGLGIES